MGEVERVKHAPVTTEDPVERTKRVPVTTEDPVERTKRVPVTTEDPVERTKHALERVAGGRNVTNRPPFSSSCRFLEMSRRIFALFPSGEQPRTGRACRPNLSLCGREDRPERRMNQDGK
jgi:hypothetical protein